MRNTLVLLTMVAATSLGAQSSPNYHVTHTYELGGDGGWDYVVPDPPSHRVYIARQNRVMVVDQDTGKLPRRSHRHQRRTRHRDRTDHRPRLRHLRQRKSVVMFDLKTFKTLSRIPAAEDADAILFDAPPTASSPSTVTPTPPPSSIPAPEQLITNIPLGGKPEYGVSAGDGKVYANLTDTSEIVEIDAKAATVTRRWSTAPCKQPVAMAIDNAHHRLFSGCRSGVMAISDYQAGKVVTTVPIGTGADGAGYDPATANAFASNADGTLTVIHQDSPDKYHVIQTLTTPVGSRNMGLDPTNHRVFVVSAEFGPAPASRQERASASRNIYLDDHRS